MIKGVNRRGEEALKRKKLGSEFYTSQRTHPRPAGFTTRGGRVWKKNPPIKGQNSRSSAKARIRRNHSSPCLKSILLEGFCRKKGKEVVKGGNCPEGDESVRGKGGG